MSVVNNFLSHCVSTKQFQHKHFLHAVSWWGRYTDFFQHQNRFYFKILSDKMKLSQLYYQANRKTLQVWRAVRLAPNLWPRPHVSGYFWKRIFFIRFQKDSRPHEERFRKYPRPHEDAATFKLRCSNFDKRKQTIKMPFCCPQRSVRMLWRVVNRCLDVSVFEKLRFHPSTLVEDTEDCPFCLRPLFCW